MANANGQRDASAPASSGMREKEIAEQTDPWTALTQEERLAWKKWVDNLSDDGLWYEPFCKGFSAEYYGETEFLRFDRAGAREGRVFPEPPDDDKNYLAAEVLREADSDALRLAYGCHQQLCDIENVLCSTLAQAVERRREHDPKWQC